MKNVTIIKIGLESENQNFQLWNWDYVWTDLCVISCPLWPKEETNLILTAPNYNFDNYNSTRLSVELWFSFSWRNVWSIQGGSWRRWQPERDRSEIEFVIFIANCHCHLSSSLPICLQSTAAILTSCSNWPGWRGFREVEMKTQIGPILNPATSHGLWNFSPGPRRQFALVHTAQEPKSWCVSCFWILTNF